MIRTYKIWDKKSSINNIKADRVIEMNHRLANSEVFLILEDSKITNIEIKDNIIEFLKMPVTSTIDDVATAYLDFLAKQEEKELVK